MKKLLLSQLFVVGIVVLIHTDVMACTCIRDERTPLSQQVNQAKTNASAVFSALVLSTDLDPSEASVSVKLSVKVVWKGEVGEEVTLTTGRGGGDCGYIFEEGEDYLIYAHASELELLSTGICSRTNKLSDSAEDLKILGKGKRVRKTNSVRKGKPTGEEYAVYSTVLREIYKVDRKTYSSCCEFVIEGNTKTDREASEGTFDYAKYRSLWVDFQRRNAVSQPIANRLPFPVYHLVTEGELDKLFIEGQVMEEAARANQKPNQLITGNENWIPFYRKYPKSAGLYTLSKVGFARERSLALVYVTFRRYHSGFSRMYVLKKNGRVWSILNWSEIEPDTSTYSR